MKAVPPYTGEGDVYRKLCFDAMETVKSAASFIRGKHEDRDQITIEAKGKHNFVTGVDKESEKILVEGLSLVLPEAGFITEEGTSEKKGELFNWVIDPIDGTTNFIHGVMPFAISVGLMREEEVVAGIVYEFGLDEYFYSWKGGGAWCNGNRIQVSDVKTVNQALIATGFPYTDFGYLDEFMETVTYFMEHSHGLRRLGSAATDMAYVACGRYDGFYEYGLHAWDIAAGILLITEAGGKLCDFSGKKNPLFSETIVCSNGHIQEEFLSSTQKFMIRK